MGSDVAQTQAAEPGEDVNVEDGRVSLLRRLRKRDGVQLPPLACELRQRLLASDNAAPGEAIDLLELESQ